MIFNFHLISGELFSYDDQVFDYEFCARYSVGLQPGIKE